MNGRTLALAWRGSVSSRSSAAGLLHAPGDAVLVERGGQARWLIFMCPSGCGELLPVNLDPRAGKAWRLYQNQKKLTLFPSVWRDSGCGAHFILWRNWIWLLGLDDGFGESVEDDFSDLLKPAIVNALPIDGGLLAFTAIAEAIGANPWDVLNVCRSLARDGLIAEGTQRLRGSFRRVS